MRTLPLCVAAALAALLAACAPAVSEKTNTAAATPAAVVNGDKENGRLVYQNNCATCHGASGVEGGVGPSLRHENARMDYAATVSWIQDPRPPMPHLYPKILTMNEVRDVAAYVQSL